MRKTERQPFRWLVALIVFILAMTLTLSEANGISVPGGAGNGWRNSNNGCNHHNGGSLDSRTADAGASHDKTATQDNPSVVPEPGTLLLMGTGLGLAIWVARRKRK